MSVQSAKDFIVQLETDETLKKRLEAAVDDEARRSIIQAAGFDFTLEEFHQAVGELAAAAERELTPDELQDIAAGTAPGHWCLTHTSSERLEAAADHETRYRIIKEAGFDFNFEHYKQAVAEFAAAAGKELSREELEEIAGRGGSSQSCWSRCSSDCGPNYGCFSYHCSNH